MHGHPRDADKTFNAALLAVRNANALADTLVVAPVFQVAADKAAKCSAPGVPAAQAGDLLWTCGSWLEGGRADNGARITSFAAMDALVAELARRWPSLRTVTIAGFSAGAQMVQHYIGFADQAQAGAGSVAVRYVVADPGTWLYFDAWRPQPVADGACPGVNRWKYGTDDLPASLALVRTAAQARQRYAAADISYLEGALDSSDAKGTYYGILDKSCAAMAQGPYRISAGWRMRSTTARCSRPASGAKWWWCRAARMTWRACFRRRRRARRCSVADVPVIGSWAGTPMVRRA
jgi:hypothetical protein